MDVNKDWLEQQQLRAQIQPPMLPMQMQPTVPAAMMQQMQPAVPAAMMQQMQQMQPAVPAAMMQQMQQQHMMQHLHPMQMQQMQLHQMQLQQMQLQQLPPFQLMPWQQMQMPMQFMRALPLMPSTSEPAGVALMASMPSASSTLKLEIPKGESLDEKKPGASKQDHILADVKPGTSKQECVVADENPGTSRPHRVEKAKKLKSEKVPQHDNTDHDEKNDPDEEDVTDVRAFVKSLKARKKGSLARKAAVSSDSSTDSDSDIESPKKKTIRKRSIETEEEEDDDDDDDDDEEEEEVVKPKRRKAPTRPIKVKRKQPCKAGRKKGSGNKKPTKAEITEKLQKAEEYIKMLENKAKAQDAAVIISSDESETEWAYSNPPPTPPPPTPPPQVESDDYAIPSDDYGHLLAPEPEEPLPFVSVKALEPVDLTAPSCRVCKVHPPTHIIRPCSHVGLCEECSPRYTDQFKSCPGCFQTHFIILDRAFIG